MRWIVRGILPCLFVLAACGGKTPEAQNPSDTDENAAPEGESGDKPLTAEEKAARRAERAEQARADKRDKGNQADKADKADKADADDKGAACTGAQMNDLAAVLSQSSCIVPNGNPDGKQPDLGDVLEVKASADKRRVAPGANAKITVVFRNKGKADLPLDFVVDPEPRFDFELYTEKGTRADKPAGAEPSLPSEVANAPASDKQVARITLPPQGTARISLSWDAVKFKWASKDRAKGAVAGRGYPREPAGPLPKGKYVLRVLTPLVNVFDGADHDMSQPRTSIEVGGS